MAKLKAEFEQVRAHKYQLNFEYPDDDVIKLLRTTYGKPQTGAGASASDADATVARLLENGMENLSPEMLQKLQERLQQPKQ